MKRSDFSYELPRELIAQYPLAQRSASRLLCLSGTDGALSHRQFTDLPDLLQPNDLLVFNNTRVIPARLWGHKDTGGRVEILIERVTGRLTALAHIRASKSPRPGTGIRLTRAPQLANSGANSGTPTNSAANSGGTNSGTPTNSATNSGTPTVSLTVTGREGELFAIESGGGISVAEVLSTWGHMPLPPYISRDDDTADRERYQTVYAEREGAVAAPTAGLHFDEALLSQLDARGIRRATVTLHVGAATFQPVRSEHIEDHHMHSELVEVGREVCDAIEDTHQKGGRVVAVGTTAVRSLEAACTAGGGPQPFSGDTDIFITPGYGFRCVDALITNFHLPESTLLMLVSAFAGREHIMAAYRAAIAERYRFFSYGDAMFISRNPGSPAPS